MRYLLLLCGASALFASCSSGSGDSGTQDQATPKASLFAGTWVSEELTIRLHTAYGIQDSSAVFSAKRSNWSSVMGMLPVETTFYPDYTFTALYRHRDSTISAQTSGYFELLGQDSIILYRLQPSPEVIRHAWVNKNDSVMGFSSRLDYDRDGERDDEMYALNRRISR
jgi:hypothetical protein